MKRIYHFLFVAAALLGFAACENVPAPYELNTTTEVQADPVGNGTLSEPYNVIKALNVINNGEYTDSKVYVKGIVSQIDDSDFSTNYGNLTYYISDSGKRNKQLEVYRGYGINGAKFGSAEELAVGDTVIVCGVITMYSSTPEFTQGSSIVYQSGKTEQPNGGSESTPSGDGTVDNPYNPAGANAFIATLGADVESENNIYVKGKICSIKENSTSQFGNASFYISEDGSTGSEQFYVYRTYYLDNKKFTQDNMLNVGDEVVICGKVVNYKGNTAETVQNKSYIYSINSNGGNGGNGGDEPNITGDNLLANGDFESWAGGLPTNWKSASTASNADLSQSTEAHSGSYAVKVGYNETQNKRLAYKELTLKKGTYEFSFYAKATTSAASQCQPGYVPVTNGSVGSYNYLGYESLSTDWTHISKTFTLDAETTICLVVMNPKTSNYATAQDILIDDATLKTNDGGLVDGGNGGGDTPNPPAGDAEHITIADFLAKADPSTVYELTGVVHNITNTLYGNFDLVDETGTIFIYGLLDKDGQAQKFANMGIEEGDEVTLTGAYKDYNGKAEIANAQFISMKKGNGGGNGGDEPTPDPTPTGDNLLANGDFEIWSGGLPTCWKSASTASNADLSQSTEAHSGSYAVKVGFNATQNKRLAYKEMELAAGKYKFQFYAKATTSAASQCQPGYVPVKDGSVGSYTYLGYQSINNSEWTLVTGEFELAATTTVCLVVMNPKNSSYATAQDILIDDASLVKE